MKTATKSMKEFLMSDGNGHVKWPAFITAILAMVGLMFVMSKSFKTDLDKNFTISAFEQFEKRIDVHFKNVDDNIALIREDIKGLKK